MKKCVDDIDALLVFLLDARTAWSPNGFDMMGLVGHAGAAPSGPICLGAISERDDLEVSEKLLGMSPSREVDFYRIVEELSREWRLPMIRAYSGVRSLGPERALVPVKALSDDPSGHFVQMKFRPHLAAALRVAGAGRAAGA